MLNNQPPEKQHHRLDGVLQVHSIFATIQGEGPFAGQPATFVRLTGCNLQCPLCDTEYTSQRHFMSPDSVLLEVESKTAPNKLVVISGGEPFRQNLTPLVEHLCSRGYRVQIETNGTLAPSPRLTLDVTVVCSPKTGRVNPKLYPYIDAYKYVVRQGQINPADGLPELALDHPAEPQVARPHTDFAGQIFVQPADEQDVDRNAVNLIEAMASALKHGYTLCLQQHKILHLE